MSMTGVVAGGMKGQRHGSRRRVSFVVAVWPTIVSRWLTEIVVRKQSPRRLFFDAGSRRNGFMCNSKARLMETSRASAPAKVIVFGEHAVVYGEPAVAAAIDVRAHATCTFTDKNCNSVVSSDLGVEFEWPCEEKEAHKRAPKPLAPLVFIVNEIQSQSNRRDPVALELKSDIPVASGLGSSAAVSVATVAAVSKQLGCPFDQERISELAWEAEKITHGNPSGIDNTVSTYGSLVKFKKGKIAARTIDFELPIVVGNSGVQRSTRDVVAAVAEARGRHEAVVDKILNAMGSIAETGFEHLANGNMEELSELISMNHELLEAIGVGHPILTKMCNIALENGALAAKLTGAGRGGVMIALCDDKKYSIAVQKALSDAGFAAFETKISADGVIYTEFFD